MEETQYQGQVLSFIDLINKHSIEIPIIQRDYAQGRQDKQKIRHLFLKALHESLINEQNLMLDFVYGSVVADNTFQPLDGQQRLTTLFLLHWYASLSTTDNVESILSKFTYETRISSRNFCQSLVSNKIELVQDLKPSAQIINSPWFYLSWKKDPTIDAMLRTIDDIHFMFYDIENLWLKLSDKDSLIKFYFVNLENIGLSDDLYIKMNARGKLLTTFENFKATLEKKINDDNWEDNIQYIEKFEYKIDTIWTDFFWNNFRQNNSIDLALLNLFSTILMNRQSILRDKETEERINIISSLQADSNNLTSQWMNQNDFEYIKEILDLLSSKYDEIKNYTLQIPFFRHSASEGFISKIVNDNKGASYTHKVLLFAQLEYFRRCSEYNFEKYSEWMRVVRNIVSRGDIEKSGKRPDIIRSPQTFDGVIFLVNELANGCDDIYKNLSDSRFSINSTFAKEQVEEERIKAKIFQEKPHLKTVLYQFEDTDLLRGKISFIFYCINYDGNPTNLNETLLEQIKDVILKYFQSDEFLNNDLRRALLATNVEDKYSFYNYWWSYWNVAQCNKRRIIDNFREIEYIINSDFKDYIKTLILKLIDEDLIQLLENLSFPETFPNWKKRLIKEKELLDKNDSNYIGIPDYEEFCYLLKSKRPRDLNGCIKIE